MILLNCNGGYMDVKQAQVLQDLKYLTYEYDDLMKKKIRLKNILIV